MEHYTHILLVAATPFEIAPTMQFLQNNFSKINDNCFEINEKRIEILITGVGIAKTALHLGRYLSEQNKPDFALNVGIAGAFMHSLLPLGSVVEVVQECYADLGAEYRDGSFVHAFEMGLTDCKFIENKISVMPNLPKVNGLTIQKVHGYAPSIEKIVQMYPNAEIETMEGAAFFEALTYFNIPFSEVRAISNLIEPRNKSAWQIEKAIKNLNDFLIKNVLQNTVITS